MRMHLRLELELMACSDGDKTIDVDVCKFCSVK